VSNFISGAQFSLTTAFQLSGTLTFITALLNHIVAVNQTKASNLCFSSSVSRESLKSFNGLNHITE
jgi:hypothetical protein